MADARRAMPSDRIEPLFKSRRRRLVDLFCKAGGATAGYQRAGFYVVGVDIEPQPNYCGDEFVQADALTFPLDGFDAVHASPPCHDHSTVTGRNRRAQGSKGTGWMLTAAITRCRENRRALGGGKCRYCPLPA